MVRAPPSLPGPGPQLAAWLLVGPVGSRLLLTLCSLFQELPALTSQTWTVTNVLLWAPGTALPTGASLHPARTFETAPLLKSPQITQFACAICFLLGP